MESQLTFNISLPFVEIAKSLNKHLAPILYEGIEEQPGQAPMSLKVVREGLIHVSQKDEVLVIEADVHVWVKIHGKRRLLDIWKDLPGVSVEETDFNLQVKFYTNIQLHSNWELESQTVGNFIWTRKPKVGLGILNINVSQIVGPILQDQIISIANQIDEFIITEIDLPTKIQQIWEELCSPYKLSEEWISYFLLFSPDIHLNVDGPFWDSNQLSLKMMTNHVPSFYIQHSEPSFKLRKIKRFKRTSFKRNLPTKYNVHIDLKDAALYLQNQTIEVSPSINILINSSSIQILNEQYQLALEIQIAIENKIFKKMFEGKVDLHFRLKLGNEDQWIVWVLDTYQLTTSNFLLGWWDTFNHASAISQLEEKLNIWLKETQADLITQGKAFLSGTEMHPNAYLSGKLGQTSPIKTMQLGNIMVLTLESDLYINLKLHNF